MTYDELAYRAKMDFITSLKRTKFVHPSTGEINASEVARLVGMSTPTVSKFCNSPRRVSENFIRRVSERVPGMETAYAEFRIAVDRPWVPRPFYRDATAAVDDAADIAKAVDDVAAAVEALRRAALRAAG